MTTKRPPNAPDRALDRPDPWLLGHRLTAPLLSVAECRQLAAWFDDDRRFRATIDMAQHRYGEGRYRYFDYPLPPMVSALRAQLYGELVGEANEWRAGVDEHLPEYPPTMAEYLERCHQLEQRRATPLLLRYEAGGYNCLHQDLYGAESFPLQATVLLSSPDDFEGGEFLLVEQRPRQQSRGTAITLQQGQAVIFPSSWRPVANASGGWHRVTVRHGVSTVRAGTRLTLGIIFHDAA